MKKLRMISDWDIEFGMKGPKEGDIVEISEPVLDEETGFIDFWFVKFNGENYEVYPYEVEEVTE